MKYSIYQIPFPTTPEEEKEYVRYSFVHLDWIDEVKLSRYKKVYEGVIGEGNPNEKLEDLFRMFNLNHPEDFKGHSLSVSDLIKLDNKFYYCDAFGWTNIKFNKFGIYVVRKNK